MGILIAIILGVVVVGGGAYYVMQQNAAPQTPVYQDQTNTKPTTQAGTTNAPVVQPTTQSAQQKTNTAVVWSDMLIYFKQCEVKSVSATHAELPYETFVLKNGKILKSIPPAPGDDHISPIGKAINENRNTCGEVAWSTE